MHKRNKIQTERFLKGKAKANEARKIIRELNQEVLNDDLAAEWEEAGNAKPTAATGEALSELYAQMANMPVPEQPSGYNLIKFAAVFFIIVGTAMWWLISNTHTGNSKPITAIVERRLENNTSNALHFTLEDSSTITLLPQAILKYNYDSMVYGSKRDLFLSGMAHFDVHKNPQRPLTVYTSTLYITALGTSFDVIDTTGTCRVKLYSGKVVVNNSQPGKYWNVPVYLLPGEEVDLQHHKTKLRIPEKKPVLPEVIKKPENKTENTLRFENASLQDVFAILERKYHHTIEADSSIGKHRFFTGEVLPGDSLPVVLKIVCSMNGLHLQESSGIWVIKP